jgi:hypothetical protein
VRADLFGAARLLTVPTLALIGLAIFAPGRLELGLRIYALVLAAAAIAVVLLALRRAYPPETALRERTPAESRRRPPPTLGRLEHEVALGVAGSFDLHYRLVPRLRALASGLLEARRRAPLDASGGAARTILGDDAWELVRRDRPAPQDRLARGMPPSALERVVAALEAI